MRVIALLAAIYGTLGGQGQGELVKAPPTAIVGNVIRVTEHITELEANGLGYKLVIDDPPTCASNEYAVATGYDFDSETSGKRIRRTYRVETIVPAPRRWTPLSIKRSAAKLGYWDALKAFLTAANAYDDFCMAQYEAEDDADFVTLMAAARQEFGDSAVDSILSNAEVEP